MPRRPRVISALVILTAGLLALGVLAGTAVKRSKERISFDMVVQTLQPPACRTRVGM